MSKLGYKISSVLICDDIRREASGKEILIGVYSSDIIVSSIPANITRLSFRIILNVEHTEFKRWHFIIDSPSQRDLIAQKGSIKIERAGRPSIFSLSIPLLAVLETGVFKIRFGLDAPARKIGEFGVRLPESEAERARLGN